MLQVGLSTLPCSTGHLPRGFVSSTIIGILCCGVVLCNMLQVQQLVVTKRFHFGVPARLLLI